MRKYTCNKSAAFSWASLFMIFGNSVKYLHSTYRVGNIEQTVINHPCYD